MTDNDMRAAAERLYVFATTAMKGTPAQAPAYWDSAHMHVYGGTPHTKLGDMLAMANVYLAANPTDDTEPVTFDWLTTQAERCMDEGYWDVPPSGEVWWEIGPVSFTCENYQNDPGEPVDVLAADWQVDGEKLPAMLAPRTRGDLRRLLRLAGGATA